MRFFLTVLAIMSLVYEAAATPQHANNPRRRMTLPLWPGNLSGLERWYDASRETGSDNSTLSTLSDWSVNNVDGTATGAPKLRTIYPYIMRGQNIIRFDGTNDAYNFTSVSGTAQTVFAVVRHNTTGIRVYAGDNTLNNYLSMHPAATASVAQAANNHTDLHSTAPASQARWSIVIWNRDGATRTISFNGSVVTRTTSAVLAGDTFAFSNVGGSAGYRWLGDIAEIGYYNRAITASEQVQLESYLAAKWFAPTVVACDGNSLTYGTGATAGADYPSVMRESLGVSGFDVRNHGVAAQTIDQMASDFTAQVLTPVNAVYNTKKIVVLWEFANAMVTQSSVDCQADFSSLCDVAQAAGWKVVAVTITAASNSGSVDATWQTKRNECNTWLRDPARLVANGGNINVVADLAADAAFATGGVTLNPTYYSDYIHFTAAGYAVAAGVIKTAVLTQ